MHYATVCRKRDCQRNPQVVITWTDGIVSAHSEAHARSLTSFSLPGEVVAVEPIIAECGR